jgi:polyhydroxybutyrate depolymerase
MIRRSYVLLGLLVLCLAVLPQPARALQGDDPTPAPTETPGSQVVEDIDRPGNYVVEVLSGGMQRQFILYVPESYDPEIPAPLVFNFHGAGSYASEHMYFSETAQKADEAGFILVYPDAVASAANWFFWSGDTGVDDVGFVQDMIRLTSDKLNIDPLRIYAIGYSNGGGMANRLACDLSGEIAAIAQVSGTYPFQDACAPQRPVPVLTFHGTDDTILAYDGSPGGTLSARGWVTQWAARNGCASGPAVTFEQDEVTGETWGDCLDGADAALYTLDGLGHGWPRTEPPERPSAFAPETSIEVNDVIWSFFEAHPMPAEPSAAVFVPEIRAFDLEGLTGEKVFAPEPGDYAGTLLSLGLPRLYLIHVPPGYEHDTPTPVVLNFHGRGSTSSEMALISQMSVAADRDGYIVVYPHSYGDSRQWNFWGTTVAGWPDDVQYVRDILDELSQAFSIDPARVYATGYSNGGGMADRLACDLSDRIAAMGQVAGTYLAGADCAPQRPVPVLTLHGTDDTILPYDGMEGGALSAVEWAANWAARNGCTGESSVTFEEGAVTGETWTGCLEGADVVLYTVEGGGHDWFRTEPVPDTTYDWPTTNIDANAALWAFFEAHPMPPAGEDDQD